jgi:hypothetical protein
MPRLPQKRKPFKNSLMKRNLRPRKSFKSNKVKIKREPIKTRKLSTPIYLAKNERLT